MKTTMKGGSSPSDLVKQITKTRQSNPYGSGLRWEFVLLISLAGAIYATSCHLTLETVSSVSWLPFRFGGLPCSILGRLGVTPPSLLNDFLTSNFGIVWCCSRFRLRPICRNGKRLWLYSWSHTRFFATPIDGGTSIPISGTFHFCGGGFRAIHTEASFIVCLQRLLGAT